VDSPDKLLCPSYKCVTGAMLLGIVQADGTIAFLGRPVRIDQRFVRVAQQGRAPEKRFRFAGTCAEGACMHWAGNRCELAEKLSGSSETRPEFPECGIRLSCRWHAEQGHAACHVCVDIVRGSEADANLGAAVP
jgi:hypothetical protein